MVQAAHEDLARLLKEGKVEEATTTHYFDDAIFIESGGKFADGRDGT